MVFWLLTWLAEFFFSRKRSQASSQLYECGFRSVSDLGLQADLGLSLAAAFLILYDAEFAFLAPAIFSLGQAGLGAAQVLLIFIFLIGLSLAYDLSREGLSYVV